MIKSILFGTVVAAAAFAASAASAEIVFQGTMLTTAAQNCAKHAVGDIAEVNFHPKLPGQQDDSEGITETIRQFELAGYHVDHAFSPAFQPVTDVSYTKDGINTTWKGTKIKLTRSPSAITDATRYLKINGQMTKPENDPGAGGGVCTITFEISLIRQPN